MDPDSEAKLSTTKQLQYLILAGAFLAGCNSNKVKTALQKSTDSSSVAQSAAAPIAAVPDSSQAGNTIYLTFDDGPNRGTRHVLDALTEAQVPASLFIIGEQVYGSQWQTALFDSIRNNRLIEIANHSFTHAHNHFARFYLSPAGVISDFQRCADSLGLTANIVRTPARNIWRLHTIAATDIASSKNAADSLRLAGFNVMGWDLEWHFNNQMHPTKTSEELVSQIDTLFSKRQMKIPGHLVLLAHDQVFADSTDAASLKDFLTRLKSSGKYNFAVISRYPGINN